MNNLDNFEFISDGIEKGYDGPLTWVLEDDKLILKKGCIYEYEKKNPLVLREYIKQFDIDIRKSDSNKVWDIFKEYGINEDLVIRLIAIYDNYCDSRDFTSIANEWCRLLTNIQYDNVSKALRELRVDSILGKTKERILKR